MAYNPHPALVQAIRSQVPERDAQAVLLATALAESGGRLDAIGDQGRSHGPYQEYDLGRGSGIPIPQRRDPVASTLRAYNEFKRYRTADPGVWAARAQRPADPTGYAAKIRALLPEATRILGGSGGVAATGTATAAAPARSPALPMNISGGFDVGSMNRIAAYLARSERDVLEGREPRDIIPLLSKLKMRQVSIPAPAAPSLPITRGGGGTAVNRQGWEAPGYGWANSLAKQFGVTVSSTYRDPARNRRVGGSPTSAHMRHGAAADFAGPPAAMRRLAESLIRSGIAKEVFYDPLGYYWDDGRVIKGSIGGHSDHVHATLR